MAKRKNVAAGTSDGSEYILGTATLRVMGKSGDACATYPLIANLDVLDKLPAEGQRAIREAMAVVEAAQARGSRIMAISPATATTPAVQTRYLERFDPSVANIMIVPMIRGGAR